MENENHNELLAKLRGEEPGPPLPSNVRRSQLTPKQQQDMSDAWIANIIAKRADQVTPEERETLRSEVSRALKGLGY